MSSVFVVSKAKPVGFPICMQNKRYGAFTGNQTFNEFYYLKIC